MEKHLIELKEVQAKQGKDIEELKVIQAKQGKDIEELKAIQAKQGKDIEELKRVQNEHSKELKDIRNILDNHTHILDDLQRSMVIIEDCIANKISVLFDAVVANQEKITANDKMLDKEERTLQFHSVKISILEDTLNKHSEQLAKLNSK